VVIEMENINDWLKEDGRFTTLVQALQAVGLDTVLAKEGPFTLFAPTDEAFSRLPEGSMENLLGDKERLSEVLQYHVVSGLYMADDLAELQSLTTEQGGILPVSVNDDGALIVDQAEIVKEDVECANGVIQVIDLVLIPEIATR
jgi:transforming growth factor-beta-induced protein